MVATDPGLMPEVEEAIAAINARLLVLETVVEENTPITEFDLGPDNVTEDWANLIMDI